MSSETLIFLLLVIGLPVRMMSGARLVSPLVSAVRLARASTTAAWAVNPAATSRSSALNIGRPRRRSTVTTPRTVAQRQDHQRAHLQLAGPVVRRRLRRVQPGRRRVVEHVAEQRMVRGHLDTARSSQPSLTSGLHRCPSGVVRHTRNPTVGALRTGFRARLFPPAVAAARRAAGL